MRRQSTLFDFWQSGAEEDEEQPDEMHQDQHEWDEEALEKKFKNLYWSRIISLHHFRAGENQRWPMLPDIKEDIETFRTLDHPDDDQWQLRFDPKAFCENREELKLEDHQMTKRTLHKKAIEVTELRTKIEAKAATMETVEDPPAQIIKEPRTRVGLQYSTGTRNPDGVGEGLRKSLEQADVVPSSKYKKRNLKELTAEEKISIAHAVLVGKCFHMDVARQHRITASLVGRLVKGLRNDASLLKHW